MIPSTSTEARERKSCQFGTACYRKNPQHRIDEAHPGDVDYKEVNVVNSDTSSQITLAQSHTELLLTSSSHKCCETFQVKAAQSPEDNGGAVNSMNDRPECGR